MLHAAAAEFFSFVIYQFDSAACVDSKSRKITVLSRPSIADRIEEYLAAQAAAVADEEGQEEETMYQRLATM